MPSYTQRDRESLRRDYKRRLKALRKKLVEARRCCKLNQTTVARMLGTTQSYISKIERTGKVDAIRMERLATIYRKPLTDFLTLPLATRDVDYYMGLHDAGWQNPPKKNLEWYRYHKPRS